MSVARIIHGRVCDFVGGGRKAGDRVTLSLGSKSKDGIWCEFTTYTLTEPAGIVNGEPYWYLSECSPIAACDACTSVAVEVRV